MFGAATNAQVRQGWAEVSEVFEDLATHFGGAEAYDFELLAAEASENLAYMTGLEHKTALIDGQNRTYTLRVTQIYRREKDTWKTIHRHAETGPRK
ncbi:nuclear transport factor 2 family protein [Kibdelosporangium lantanae]|uniref:Nuclear transport factor 2 family protein n=1 Tax=Kibdelosporangium lantanae TaxID=1497396 RepID=A0ABW3M7K2_9PSEU